MKVILKNSKMEFHTVSTKTRTFTLEGKTTATDKSYAAISLPVIGGNVYSFVLPESAWVTNETGSNYIVYVTSEQGILTGSVATDTYLYTKNRLLYVYVPEGISSVIFAAKIALGSSISVTMKRVNASWESLYDDALSVTEGTEKSVLVNKDCTTSNVRISSRDVTVVSKINVAVASSWSTAATAICTENGVPVVASFTKPLEEGKFRIYIQASSVLKSGSVNIKVEKLVLTDIQ